MPYLKQKFLLLGICAEEGFIIIIENSEEVDLPISPTSIQELPKGGPFVHRILLK